MADALVSLLIDNLGSMAFEKIKEEIGLLTGVEEEIEKLKNTLLNIQAVLEDAEKRQLSDAAVAIWLEKLKDVSLDIDDVLDEWLTPTALKSKMEETRDEDEKAGSAKKKVWLSLLSLCVCSAGGAIDEVRKRHLIAQEIRNLNESLDGMAKDKDRFKLERVERVDGASGAALSVRKITTSLLNEKEICGRDVEKEVLICKLLRAMGRKKTGDRGFDTVSLVGMGGLGKTTLAQVAYNDDRVKNHFDSRIWVCVSDPFDEIKIARAVSEGVTGHTETSSELNILVQRIHELVEGKRFLLVLDDVWNENYDKWEELEKSLKNGAAGSMVLVTTRNEKISATMRVSKHDMLTLEILSDEHCWIIFSQKAFFDKTDKEFKRLEDVGRQIARKSNGLPLLAKTLGGLMSSKKTIFQWNSVLKNELWELKDVQAIFAPFLLSYYDLLPSEKRCLLYCSVFPKDYVIQKDKLICMWMSQGFFGCNLNLEEEGEACFESLAMRSFFQDFKLEQEVYPIFTCQMHDVVCDFVKFLTRNEYCVVEDLNGPKNTKNQLGESIRHLTMNVEVDMDIERVFKYNDKKSKLRTLFCERAKFSVEDLDNLFLRHTRIRTLILVETPSIPTEIGKLIHLRYLDLSSTRCDELPDTVCNLYNLQMLNLEKTRCKKLSENINKLTNLRYLNLSDCDMTNLPDSICNLPKLQTLMLYSCSNLELLPEGFGKLVELRYLNLSYCNKLVGIPKGFVSLTNLQNLNMEFPITKDESSLNLEDLKLMNHVLKSQTHFGFYGCTNLCNESEARDIGIKHMELLTQLRIGFKDVKESKEEEGIEDHERNLLENLEPNPNLEILYIEDYLGTTVLPKWMMSLVNLTTLYLIKCRRCTDLPPLGKLPSLKTLYVECFERLEKVGSEFLGFGNDDDEGGLGKGDIGEKSSFTSFPKLVTLIFWDLDQWESWVGTKDVTTTIMPCLAYLSLIQCRSLKALPDFLPLAVTEVACIRQCDILERNRYDGDFPAPSSSSAVLASSSLPHEVTLEELKIR